MAPPSVLAMMAPPGAQQEAVQTAGSSSASSAAAPSSSSSSGTSSLSSRCVLYTSFRSHISRRFGAHVQMPPEPAGSKLTEGHGTRRGPLARTSCVARDQTTSVGSGSPLSAASSSPEREKAIAVYSSGASPCSDMTWNMSG